MIICSFSWKILLELGSESSAVSMGSNNFTPDNTDVIFPGTSGFGSQISGLVCEAASFTHVKFSFLDGLDTFNLQ